MIIPVFAGLHAMATADALGGIEQNAARLAVEQPSGGNQVAVFLIKNICRFRRHAAPFGLTFRVGLSLTFCCRQLNGAVFESRIEEEQGRINNGQWKMAVCSGDLCFAISPD